LDGPLSHALTKAANCATCFAEGFDTITWAYPNQRFVPASGVQDRSAAAMVRGYYVTAYHVLNGCRYKPPEVDLENTNIENSQNTALFLFSCFQYILMSVVLSVGPPFRKPMLSNGMPCPLRPRRPLTVPVPYLFTITVDLLCAVYMLFGPSRWVTRVMQLTFLSGNFASWLLVLAISSFLLSWLADRVFFPRLARGLGHVYTYLLPTHRKQRRRYKVLLDEMQQ
jgi:cation-transporting ATPase 13A2